MKSLDLVEEVKQRKKRQIEPVKVCQSSKTSLKQDSNKKKEDKKVKSQQDQIVEKQPVKLKRRFDELDDIDQLTFQFQKLELTSSDRRKTYEKKFEEFEQHIAKFQFLKTIRDEKQFEDQIKLFYQGFANSLKTYQKVDKLKIFLFYALDQVFEDNELNALFDNCSKSCSFAMDRSKPEQMKKVLTKSIEELFIGHSQ